MSTSIVSGSRLSNGVTGYATIPLIVVKVHSKRIRMVGGRGQWQSIASGWERRALRA